MLIRDQARMAIERCRKLASFSEQAGRTTRTFLSSPMRDCHREIAAWVEPLGARVRIDAAGNFRALYPAADANAPRLLVGSHLDTVPDGGAFDGALGVVLGATLMENLEGKRLPFSIELLGFSEEEGVRFGVPFIGSRALVGRVDEDLLRRPDEHGISVRTAIERFGLHPSELPEARIESNVLGYVEFHIEQGPVLEELGLPLAVVDAIAGQSRLEFTFFGCANHAGTTPMNLRRDALAGAAEWIATVEQEGRRVPELVATVGAVEAKPGVSNVIAAEVRLTLDVRHRTDDVRKASVEILIRRAEQIAAYRRLSLRHEERLNQTSVAMDSLLISHAEEALRRAQCLPHRMVSGAGHDAMILAEAVASVMILLRTPGGISHSPEESVQPSDVAKAIEAGAHLLDVLASSPAFEHKETQNAYTRPDS
ncbi:MAG: allantoate amidohydrolase [Acidobacteria bacterium]|nr:allantoate amidohydrolase [Acidobacteriota bacterium]